MNYKIQEISNLFHMSREMLRYYEKQGALSPIRESDNNYRQYTIWDIFNLCEFLQLKEFNITVKELADIKNRDYSFHIRKKLYEYKDNLNHELFYKNLLLQRVNQLLDAIECYEYNEGNYWVKRVSANYMFHFVSSNGDEYGKIDTSDDIRKVILSPDILTFLDSVIEINENDDWWFSISDEYKSLLPNEILEQATFISSEKCLCTVINMGEIGEFNNHCADNAIEYIKSKGYTINGPIRGVILGRGTENEQYIRRMELRIPII